jgi:hypothetical protein
LLSALSGDTAGIAVMLIYYWEQWRVFLNLIGLFCIPVWLMFFLPLHAFLPRSTQFLNSGFYAGIGGAVSAVALMGYFFCLPDTDLLWLLLPAGFVAGIVAGVVSSVFARHYGASMA